MGFWQESASSEGASRAEKIPPGQHDLTIIKVVFGSKQGGYFTSTNGDRQIMVVFADPQNREAAQMYTLSSKAAWTLAKLLEAAGADLKKMDERGITPEKFTDEGFAQANLVNRKLRAEVEYEESKGKEYARVTPLRRPSPSASEREQIEDEIPI